MRNPFGMDEACTNCPALVESRERIVHGYGDVVADFVFVEEAPAVAVEAAGHPLPTEGSFVDVLARLGFLPGETDAADEPLLRNAFLTRLTRCRHPERAPTESEVSACDPFLTAEIRSINPELIIPVGQRALTVLAREYTTRAPAGLAVEELHGEILRGRGFELLPMVRREDLTDARANAFVDAMRETMDRDYRQTKGGRPR